MHQYPNRPWWQQTNDDQDEAAREQLTPGSYRAYADATWQGADEMSEIPTQRTPRPEYRHQHHDQQQRAPRRPAAAIPVPAPARITWHLDPNSEHPVPKRGTYRPVLHDESGVWEVDTIAWDEPVHELDLRPWRCRAEGCNEYWYEGMWPVKVPYTGYVVRRQGQAIKRDHVTACCPRHRDAIERTTRMEAIRKRMHRFNVFHRKERH